MTIVATVAHLSYCELLLAEYTEIDLGYVWLRPYRPHQANLQRCPNSSWNERRKWIGGDERGGLEGPDTSVDVIYTLLLMLVYDYHAAVVSNSHANS